MLQMDLGVLEGQTRGGYFLDSIVDPSVNPPPWWNIFINSYLKASLRDFVLYYRVFIDTGHPKIWLMVMWKGIYTKIPNKFELSSSQVVKKCKTNSKAVKSCQKVSKSTKVVKKCQKIQNLSKVVKRCQKL